MLPRNILVILAIVISTSSSSGENIKLEWSFGQPLPISKVLNSGAEQDLYCSVHASTQRYAIFLMCPVHNSICMENCVPNDENMYISCVNVSTTDTIIFRYTIKVFKKYEGAWKCQYGAIISSDVQLAVTNKPYISSFKARPNPVWRGSPLNVTCQVLPMPGINGIQLWRLSGDNSTTLIQSDYREGSDKYSHSVIINSATPQFDDHLQCMVFTDAGMISTKLLKINIFYFPDKLRLTSSSRDHTFPMGFLLSFHCSSEGGNPRPALSLYRRRMLGAAEKLPDTSILLTKADNGAIFYCKIDKIADVISTMTSNEISIKVKYPPDNIDLQEDLTGQLTESQIQTLTCLSQGGSEPPSQIEWSMSDHFGRNISANDLYRIIEQVKSYRNNSTTLKNSIRVNVLRHLNGYSISCSIIYDRRTIYTQKRVIKIAFAPNSVTLNSNPLGAIAHGTSVILSCTTDTSNPPSKIQWSRTKPGQKSEDVTLHSNMDLIPANYSGVSIVSTLSIHDVSKSDHGNMYKCIVSHAYINFEIVKEYFLNVLFPPVIQVYYYPHSVEEGEQVYLQCRTTGGNPNNLSLYRFQWQFCFVNVTYQEPTNTDISRKPPSDVRKHCTPNFNGFAFHQSQTLNITSVSSKQRGWYACLVFSPGGTANGYSFLNVLYPPVLIAQTPERVYRKISTDVALRFEVLSNPLDIDVKWYFRSRQKQLIHDQLYNSKVQSMSGTKKELQIKSYDARMESVVLDNCTVSLVVRSISLADFGDYFCEVSNRIGKRSIQFQVMPANDVTIPETSITVQFSGRSVLVSYEPPTQGHFTHMILRICSLEPAGNCKDMHISNPLSGKATTTMHRSPTSFSYRILVYNGSSLLQITNPIQKNFALQGGHWVEMSFEMMVAVIIGVVGIFILLFAALLTLILLKCKHNKCKENFFVENNSTLTGNSHRRQDFFLLNSSANTTLIKNGCHCFPNYPLELRSENGSDHSAPSQDTRIYQPIMMRRKIRDNGEMSSVHSGSSCQNPDVILTEKISLGSGNNQNFIGTPQFNSLSSGTANKVSFLSGRLHSFDGQRQDLLLPEDFAMSQNMMFAAIDDGTNQTRLIPITATNLHSEYPLYFQMNSQPVPKQYETDPSTIYSMSLPLCTKPCRTDNYRENSSSTNTDSNQYSTTQDPSVIEAANETVDNSTHDGN